MSRRETLELPLPLYHSLVEAARESGLTPADWIAARLPRPFGDVATPTTAEIADANAQLRAQRVPKAQRTSTDNADIDADLLRAYGLEDAA